MRLLQPLPIYRNSPKHPGADTMPTYTSWHSWTFVGRSLIFLGLAVLVSVKTSYAESEMPVPPERIPATPSTTDPSDHPAPETYILSNGLRVVSVPIPGSETIALMTWLKVGSADDPSDKPGLAHYVEHATFSALNDHDQDEPTSDVDNSQKESNRTEAFTSFDFTAFYRVVSPGDLDDALLSQSARFAELQFNEDSIEAERDAIIAEYQETFEDDPESLLEEKIRALLWSGGPYEHSVVSSPAQTRAVETKDVQTFYEKWYIPNNAIVIAVGNVTSEDFLKSARMSFGRFRERSLPKRSRPPNVLPKIDRRFQLHDDRTRQISWTRVYTAPSYQRAGSNLAAATQLLAALLSNGDQGLLHRKLLFQQGLAEEITVEYSPDTVGDSTFLIHADLDASSDVAAFEIALDRELQRLTRQGVNSKDLDFARGEARLSDTVSRSQPLDFATMIGEALTTGRSLDHVFRWSEELSRVSAARIRDAAQHIFFPSNGVTGVLGPSKSGKRPDPL